MEHRFINDGLLLALAREIAQDHIDLLTEIEQYEALAA